MQNYCFVIDVVVTTVLNLIVLNFSRYFDNTFWSGFFVLFRGG